MPREVTARASIDVKEGGEMGNRHERHAQQDTAHKHEKDGGQRYTSEENHEATWLHDTAELSEIRRAFRARRLSRETA
eukprot:7834266-Pyramimonas_sp.AAC.1